MKVTSLQIMMAGILLSLFLTGCPREETEYSDVLHEDAVVAQAVYTPPGHDVDVGFTAMSYRSLGMDYSGNFGIRIGGGLQVSAVEVEEKFAIVFQCQHGRFIVERKELYERLKNHEGEKVDVEYREIYRTRYDTNKENGKEEVVNRTLKGYDFLEAKLK